MATEQKFTVEVSSDFPEFWRYNTALMCGCFDAQDHRTDFAAAEDVVAEVGANLTSAPGNYPAHRIAVLETPPADHIVLYAYIIPHTLPRESDIAGSEPFPLLVRVSAGGREVLNRPCRINQWSGASIELRIDGRGLMAAPASEK